jgi:hypothetical protein
LPARPKRLSLYFKGLLLANRDILAPSRRVYGRIITESEIMNFNYLEFSFRDYVSQDAAVQTLAACLNLPELTFVSTSEYLKWAQLAGDDWPKEVTKYAEVTFNWSDMGYKTLMNVVYAGEDLPDSRLEEICYGLAKRLDTEVAIGDFIHIEYPDTFIVYTPSGERWFGVDACKGYNELIKAEYEDE